MSRIKGATLVVAMFAMSAIAIASASAALPEFDGPFPNQFTGTQIGEGKLETLGGRTVACTGGSASGTIQAAKHLLVKGILYTGCKSTTFGAGKCQNGSTEGDIITLPLLGLLGYIKLTTPKEAGVLFEPDNGIDHFASFKCKTLIGEETITVKGTTICHISPINTKGTKYTLECKETNGMQEPSLFDGATADDKLLTKGEGPENFGFEESAVSSTTEVITKEATLILA